MRYKRPSAKGIMRLREAALVVVLSFGVVLPSAAALAGPSPRFLPVASGRFLGRTWSVGIAKANDRRCYELSLGGRIGGGDSVCESNRQFNEPWSRRLGESDLNNSASVELDITSPQVRRLDPSAGSSPRDATEPTSEANMAQCCHPGDYGSAGREGSCQQSFPLCDSSGRREPVCGESSSVR